MVRFLSKTQASVIAILLSASMIFSQSVPAPAPEGSNGCVSVATGIAAVNPEYAAIVLRNADALGVKSYQLAQPGTYWDIQMTFFVPPQDLFSNYLIYLYRRLNQASVEIVLKDLVLLMTVPRTVTTGEMIEDGNGTLLTMLSGYNLTFKPDDSWKSGFRQPSTPGTNEIGIGGPCAPGNQPNIGYEYCGGGIVQKDVAACKSAVQGVSFIAAVPYWNSSIDAAQATSSANRPPFGTANCTIGQDISPCPARRPGAELPTTVKLCDTSCQGPCCVET